MFPQSARVPYDLEQLLNPISEANPTGLWLRYEPVYDDIRHARHQENPRLSQGAWKREIKSADWALVERLATDILSHTSKDIQIAMWLIEAWSYLDGIDGTIRGFHVLNQMSQAFWPTIHPYPDDPEARIQLFEWLDETLGEHMYFFAISNPRDEYAAIPWTLADWRHAQRLQQIFQRTGDVKRESQRAMEAGEPVLTLFEQSIEQTDISFFHEALDELSRLKDQIKDLKDFLGSVWGHNAPSFRALQGVITDFDNIWRQSIIKLEAEATKKQALAPPPSLPEGQVFAPASDNIPPTSGANPGMDRQRAYRQLQDIADTLSRLEPQSPTPYILKQVASWQNKSLPEILSDIAESPGEAALVLQLLTKPSQKSVKNPVETITKEP